MSEISVAKSDALGSAAAKARATAPQPVPTSTMTGRSRPATASRTSSNRRSVVADGVNTPRLTRSITPPNRQRTTGTSLSTGSAAIVIPVRWRINSRCSGVSCSVMSSGARSNAGVIRVAGSSRDKDVRHRQLQKDCRSDALLELLDVELDRADALAGGFLDLILLLLRQFEAKPIGLHGAPNG